MREIDVPRLRKVLEHVTAEPETWNQRLWAVKTLCGTRYCVAGHAINMFDADAKFVWHNDVIAGLVSKPDGKMLSVAGHAAELLGLSMSEASLLFSSRNGLAELWYIALVLTDGEVRPPANVTLAGVNETVKNDVADVVRRREEERAW